MRSVWGNVYVLSMSYCMLVIALGELTHIFICLFKKGTLLQFVSLIFVIVPQGGIVILIVNCRLEYGK